LDIFLHGFSPSSCPQHSLKVLLLLNAKYVLNFEQNFRSRLAGVHCSCFKYLRSYSLWPAAP
jgi:hypothetical protein